MTAFGRSEIEHTFGHFSVKVRSVNKRFLDVQCALDAPFSDWEDRFRKWIGKQIFRGQVTLRLEMSLSEEAPLDVRGKEGLLHRYEAAWQKMFSDMGAFRELVLRCPDLFFSQAIAEGKEEEWTNLFRRLIDSAMESLLEAKVLEGERLEIDIRARLKALHTLHDRIVFRLPQIQEALRARVEKRLQQAALALEEHQDALHREVVFLLEKSDVAEELTRIACHLDQAESILSGKEVAVGDKLDFLMQEMQREWNTLGNKAGDAEVSHHAVEAKVEIKRIREQLQNVE